MKRVFCGCPLPTGDVGGSTFMNVASTVVGCQGCKASVNDHLSAFVFLLLWNCYDTPLDSMSGTGLINGGNGSSGETEKAFSIFWSLWRQYENFCGKRTKVASTGSLMHHPTDSVSTRAPITSMVRIYKEIAFL